MNYATDGDGRIVAAPGQQGPLANITDAELYDAIDADWQVDLSNAADTREVSMKPERGDHIGKQYTTVGGSLVTTARTAEGKESYTYCYGCGERREFGYGWDDRAREHANKHAGECRAAGGTR
ncbi:hypothetical protein [Streptomyces sp. enrichment culture]|uniref:hypothetical protein n=1 Tax=Streptomyces sp. enrichment culture TaxID=1795815 RepID=UPI003F54BA47